MWNRKELPDLTASELKDVLKRLQLSTAGNKAELVARIVTADPDGQRRRELQEDAGEASGGGMEDLPDGGHVASASPPRGNPSASRELEALRRERLLLQREIDLMR